MKRVDSARWAIIGCVAVAVGVLVLTYVDNVAVTALCLVLVVPVVLASLFLGFASAVSEHAERKRDRNPS